MDAAEMGQSKAGLGLGLALLIGALAVAIGFRKGGDGGGNGNGTTATVLKAAIEQPRVTLQALSRAQMGDLSFRDDKKLWVTTPGHAHRITTRIANLSTDFNGSPAPATMVVRFQIHQGAIVGTGDLLYNQAITVNLTAGQNLRVFSSPFVMEDLGGQHERDVFILVQHPATGETIAEAKFQPNFEVRESLVGLSADVGETPRITLGFHDESQNVHMRQHRRMGRVSRR